jgi:hypothetical protein
MTQNVIRLLVTCENKSTYRRAEGLQLREIIGVYETRSQFGTYYRLAGKYGMRIACNVGVADAV